MSNYNQTINGKGMNLKRHPFSWISSFLQNNLWNNFTVELSKYIYTPQSLNDYRRQFNIPSYELSENTINSLLNELENNMELALHSRVYTNNLVYHIPMIDFRVKEINTSTFNTLIELSQYWNIQFMLYSSGRSYHAYGNRLLTPNEWLQFMGSLLLINKPSESKLIDERWIGHRIMGGYASLRWSNNSNHYKKYPTYCGYITNSNVNLDSNYPPIEFF
ncbi:hypothetical protein ABZ131_11405 [Providencia rettgeri]